MSQQEGAMHMFDDDDSYSSHYANGGGGVCASNATISENSEPDVHDPLTNVSQLQGMPASPLLIEELQRIRKQLEEYMDVQRNFNARIEQQLAVLFNARMQRQVPRE
jgi:hypothetical protein